jgi:pyridoxamine 5'-phosphate oxidase-like protein
VRIPDLAGYGPQTTPPPDWDKVESWLERDRYYWLISSRPNGRPHSVPLWALWFNRYLYYNMSPETVTSRNLYLNPYAIAHPQDAKEAVIVEGLVDQPDPSTLDEVATEYERRFDFTLDPTDPKAPIYRLTPLIVRAWWAGDVRGTAVRWKFDEPR